MGPEQGIAPDEENTPTIRDGEMYTGRGLIDRMKALKEESGESVFRYVKKLHNGLGHPSAAVLARTLENAQAREEVVQCAKKFECAECQSRKPPTQSSEIRNCEESQTLQ